MDNTGELWKRLIERKYKGSSRVNKGKDETWRECYEVHSLSDGALIESSLQRLGKEREKALERVMAHVRDTARAQAPKRKMEEVDVPLVPHVSRSLECDLHPSTLHTRRYFINGKDRAQNLRSLSPRKHRRTASPRYSAREGHR